MVAIIPSPLLVVSTRSPQQAFRPLYFYFFKKIEQFHMFSLRKVKSRPSQGRGDDSVTSPQFSRMTTFNQRWRRNQLLPVDTVDSTIVYLSQAKMGKHRGKAKEASHRHKLSKSSRFENARSGVEDFESYYEKDCTRGDVKNYKLKWFSVLRSYDVCYFGRSLGERWSLRSCLLKILTVAAPRNL